MGAKPATSAESNPRLARWRLALAFAPSALLLVAIAACASPGSNPPTPTPVTNVAVRYQADDGRQALLEISPFQVGRNTFRVMVMDGQSKPAPADSVELRLSRPESAAEPTSVPAPHSDDGTSYVAEYDLQQTGWWDVGVVLDKLNVVNFYLRLDNPSTAPLAFAPADYASDPAAEALFKKTLQAYEGLSSVKEREELTSGLLAPTGAGITIITDYEVEADRIHYVTSSSGSTTNEFYRVGTQSCSRDVEPISAWECQGDEAQKGFDLEYLASSTAFRLGRQETVDGELSRLLLFSNPGQRAWFAWWVGEQTGYLRRQAMVAPGHFMLTRYFDHNAPLSIELPASAESGG